MDTPGKEKPAADLRDYLAEERTFLAWIRTGIACMGFGIVLAHFGIFTEQPQLAEHAFGLQPHELSCWFATALIAIGVTVNVFSALRYMRLVGYLQRGEFINRATSKQGVVIAMLLALLGLAMTMYVMLAVPQTTIMLQG
jgi:putative membrane protein